MSTLVINPQVLQPTPGEPLRGLLLLLSNRGCTLRSVTV